MIKAYGITLFRITVGVMINILLTATYAFTLSRRKLPYVKFFTLPIVLVYPFIQKYFVKGALVGAVKG